MVMRDANDLFRRPTGPVVMRHVGTDTAPTRAYVGETSDDIAKRHAESSPENPQGGQWVKFRINQGGVALPHAAMMTALRAQGYKGNDDG